MTVLAVDVGGTNLRAALVYDGAILGRASATTDSAEVGPAVEGLVTDLLRTYPDQAPHAIGVGVPEYVDAGRVTSHEVVSWPPDAAARIARVAASNDHPNVPVIIESDVRCGALAEHAALDDPDHASLLYISWGTGLSSTFVLPGGHAWPGARGEAIALGEWRDEHGRQLEDAASGRGIERAYAAATGASLDGIAVHVKALGGDAAALEAFERAGRLIGHAVRQLVHVLDPHVVVLGGGLGSADQLGWTGLLDELSGGHIRPSFPPVRPARTGADAGLLGAALFAERTAQPRDFWP
ncbi:MAG: ROK family protein [Propionicimonas sp.]